MNDIEALVIEWRDARAVIHDAIDWIKLPLETRQAQLDRLAKAEIALFERARTMVDAVPVGPHCPLPHLCEDCPPAGHPNDQDRCTPCPRRSIPDSIDPAGVLKEDGT